MRVVAAPQPRKSFRSLQRPSRVSIVEVHLPKSKVNAVHCKAQVGGYCYWTQSADVEAKRALWVKESFELSETEMEVEVLTESGDSLGVALVKLSQQGEQWFDIVGSSD